MGRCTIATEEKLDHLYVRFCTRAPKPCANFTFAKHKVHNPHIDHELFTRIQFPPTMKSLGKPREGSTWNASNVVWLRPHELNDSDFEPTLFHDGTEAGKPLLKGNFHPFVLLRSQYICEICVAHLLVCTQSVFVFQVMSCKESWVIATYLEQCQT